MSDERFDQDLRSVLQEDAPRDVPDDLRRRVGAVPATHPATSGPTRPVWRHPVPLWIGVLSAIAVLLAVGTLQFRPAPESSVGGAPSSTGSAQPSPSPAAVPNSSPSPTPSHAAAVTACRAANLLGRILSWQGAAGSRIADVEVTNTAAVPCFVRGTPGLQLVDASGRILLDSSTAGPSGQPHVASTDPTFELMPGAHLRTEVQASNYCGAAPAAPIDIAFTLPSGGGRFVSRPGPGVSSAEAVPPCNGPTAGHIEMNGWRR